MTFEKSLRKDWRYFYALWLLNVLWTLSKGFENYLDQTNPLLSPNIDWWQRDYSNWVSSPLLMMIAPPRGKKVSFAAQIAWQTVRQHTLLGLNSPFSFQPLISLLGVNLPLSVNDGVNMRLRKYINRENEHESIGSKTNTQTSTTAVTDHSVRRAAEKQQKHLT